MSVKEKTSGDVLGLAERIAAVSPADQLRMAADLLEAKNPKLAHALVTRVYQELELLHLRGAF